MPAPIEPVVTALSQISVIVRDLMPAMQRYVEVAGIGPFAVYELGPPEVTNIRLHGRPASFRALVAIAWTGDAMWELIQPLEGESMYQEFLEQHGEGMQHTLVRHAGRDIDEVIARFGAHGYEVCMSFEWRGTRFAYIDAMHDMRMVFEVLQRPEAPGPAAKGPATPPTYWYPYDPKTLEATGSPR